MWCKQATASAKSLGQRTLVLLALLAACGDPPLDKSKSTLDSGNTTQDGAVFDSKSDTKADTTGSDGTALDVALDVLADGAATDAGPIGSDAGPVGTDATGATDALIPYDVALAEFSMTGTEPAAGSTLQGPPFSFTLVFSAPLKKESVSKTTIGVISHAGGDVPGKWTVDSNKATFTTTALVAPSSRIQVDINFLVQSYQGVTLAQPLKVAFYTAPPAGMEPYAQMAARYAPVLRQAVTSEADYLQQVQLDGNWQAGDNQLNYKGKPKIAEVGWSAVETQSHVFLGYLLYWPERPAVGSASAFANDSSAVLIAVRKARPGVPEAPVALFSFFRSKTDEQSWLWMTQDQGLPKGGAYVRQVLGLDTLFPPAAADDTLGCSGLTDCVPRRAKLWQTAAMHQVCLQGDAGQASDSQCFLGAESMKAAKWIEYWPAEGAGTQAPGATAEGAKATYVLRSLYETWWPRRDEVAPDGLWQDAQFVYDPAPGRPKGDGLSWGSKFISGNALDAGRPPWAMLWKPATLSQTYYQLPRGVPWLDPAYTLMQRLGGSQQVPTYNAQTAQGLSLETCWNVFLGLDNRTTEACKW